DQQTGTDEGQDRTGGHGAGPLHGDPLPIPAAIGAGGTVLAGDHRRLTGRPVGRCSRRGVSRLTGAAGRVVAAGVTGTARWLRSLATVRLTGLAWLTGLRVAGPLRVGLVWGVGQDVSKVSGAAIVAKREPRGEGEFCPPVQVRSVRRLRTTSQRMRPQAAGRSELGSMTMSRTADLGRTAELDALQAVVAPEAWSTAPADLARMSHDASHYLLTPRAVVTPGSLPELVAALSAAHRAGLPVTFRAGGTSLSGQSGTDGVL